MSIALLDEFMDMERAAGVVDSDLPCFRFAIHGLTTNENTWI